MSITEEKLSDQIEQELSLFLQEHSVELFELNIKRQSGSVLIEVLIDKASGGISMGKCSVINKALGRVIEDKEIIQGNFYVEVSSPGLDRPLKIVKDFLRVKDREVEFDLTEPIEGSVEQRGVIEEVTQDSVKIKTKLGLVVIPLEKINKAVQVI